MFVANILYGLLAKFSWKKIFVSIKILLPWLIIFAIFQMIFYSSEGNIIFSWKFFVLTDEKLYSLGLFFLRAISAIISISVFIYSTDEREILDGLSALLKPLALIKIPVRYFVLVVGIIFRFIPLLIDEMTGIIKTQIIRGVFGNAKGLKKLKVLVPLFVPLMLQTFRKAQTLADALTARYFK
jgi:energy-coupling factor transport system ATP-binding protein